MIPMGRPREYTFNISEEWKLKVIEEMRRRKMLRQDVATAAGITASMLTRILKPLSQGGARSSSKAPRIGEIVGVPLPGAPSDQELDELMRDLQEIRMASPAAFAEHVAALVELRDSLRQVIRKARHPKK
jgi:transposase-like protein